MWVLLQWETKGTHARIRYRRDIYQHAHLQPQHRLEVGFMQRPQPVALDRIGSRCDAIDEWVIRRAWVRVSGNHEVAEKVAQAVAAARRRKCRSLF